MHSAEVQQPRLRTGLRASLAPAAAHTAAVQLLLWSTNTPDPAAALVCPLTPQPQARLKLRSKAVAFAIMAGTVAVVCFSILGALFFSRWVRG